MSGKSLFRASRRGWLLATILLGIAPFTALANTVTGSLAPSLGVNGNAQPIEVTSGSNKPASMSVTNTTVFHQGSAPLLPSSWGGSYTLTITGTDSAGNATIKKVLINYQPALVSVLTGKSGTINIPAVPVAFTDSLGRQAITTDVWKTASGTTITGPQQVWATSSAKSTTSVTLNGVQVDAGSTVSIGTLNFNGGVLSVPAMASTYGSTGSATILLSTNVSGSPVAQATLNVWSPKETLSAPQTSFTQAVTQVSVQATLSTKVCTPTTSASAAQSANMIDAPQCYLNWTALPNGLVGSATGASGRLTDSVGQQSVAYTLSIYNGSTAIQMDQGQLSLTVAPATTSILFGPSGPIPTVVAGADSVSIGLSQIQGSRCTQTTTQAAAQTATQGGSLGCWIQWTSLPDGMTQDPTKTVPWVTGIPTNPENPTVVWSDTLVMGDGTLVPIGAGNYAINVVSPVQPTVSVSGLTPIDATNYVAPYAGGKVTFLFSGSNTEETVAINRASELIYSQTLARNTSGATRTYSAMTVQPPADAWSSTTYIASGTYVNLPTMSVTDSFTVTTAPDITPLALSLSLGAKQLLDSGTANATVTMAYGSRNPVAYDPATMGQWQVKLVQYGTGSSTTDLTSFTAMDPSGVTVLPIDMSSVSANTTSLKVGAVAQLVSPLPGYNVQKTSSVLMVGVVDGAAIPGALTARATSGSSPFLASVTFKPTTYSQLGAIGSVIWNISSDGGNTWTTTTGTTTFAPKLTAGTYLINATTTNKFSGATSTTSNVSIAVYDVPTVKVTGPANAFVGDSTTFVATASVNGQTLTDTDVVTQWKYGITGAWTTGTLSQPYTANQGGNFAVSVRVRMSTSPDQASSYATANLSLSVVKVSGPRITITGPTKAEANVQSTWTANVVSPVAGVATVGGWTMPDGTQIAGNTLTWTPTGADLQAGTETLLFSAYLQGFESTSTTTQKYPVQIWQYTWPNWQLSQRKTASYAPASDTITVAPMSLTTDMYALGTLTYNWSFPDGVTVTNAANATYAVSVQQPGSYPYSVTISNDRGNITTLQDVINLPAPPAIVTTIQSTASNAYSRAPLTLSMRASTVVGHPLDKVSSYNWTLDGNPLPSTSTLFETVTLDVGDHVIGVGGTSSLGFAFGTTLPVTVVPDTPPVCTINAVDNGLSWTWRANCPDSDGKVVGYTWWVNGVQMSTSGGVLSQNKSSSLRSVQLVATDDAGVQSAPATWTP